nr:Rpn family recombination-promoting nuclease/putative transposase [Micromonospora sp. DSM 115978]
MPSQSNPHDAVFRRVLGESANAASHLRAVLPEAVIDRLDLSQLARVSGSFVDDTLRWRHSDLLFTAPLQGREALIYVVVEHQSSEDPLMPLRMLRYVIRVWDRYLGEHPEATRLPAVIPIVVHHNRRPWTGSTQVLDLLDLDPEVTGALLEYLPRLRFVLDDLSRVNEQALRARPVTPPVRMTLLLLKIASGNPNLADDLQRWTGDLRAVLDQPGGIDQFTSLLRYIQLVGETPAEDLHKLVETLGPVAEEAYVTTAEMLRAEGAARGRAEGEARGRAEALTQLLTLRFGPLPQATRGAVHAASIEQLEAWTARVLTADTLDHVLR